MNIIKIKNTNSISFKLSAVYIFESIDRSAVSLITVTINTVKEENIDDKDEYLNIKETTTHVNINSKAN